MSGKKLRAPSFFSILWQFSLVCFLYFSFFFNFSSASFVLQNTNTEYMVYLVVFKWKTKQAHHLKHMKQEIEVQPQREKRKKNHKKRTEIPFSARKNDRMPHTHIVMMWKGNKKYVIILLNKNV